MPENVLTKETLYCESADFEDAHNKTDNTIDLEELLASIGSALAGSADIPNMEQEPTELNPQSTSRAPPFSDSSLEDTTLESAFGEMCNVFHSVRDVNNDSSATKSKPQKCFNTKTSKLNSLTYHRFVFKRETANSHENESNEMKEREYKVRATGTAASIIAWGMNVGLDEEDQQTAFEIMAASYVLSFHTDAKIDFTRESSEWDNLNGHRESLLRLVRRQPNNPTPLRLFVTGPAGAGKCKCIYMLFMVPRPRHS